MKAVRLFICPEKGRAEETDRLVLKVGKGIEGDFHSGGEKQVSVCSERAFMSLGNGDGLCMGRYIPNIVVDSVPDGGFKVGDSVVIGCAILKITSLKKCFPDDCALIKEKKPCVLKDEAAFAVISSAFDGKSETEECKKDTIVLSVDK
ncbi:MAG: hypothetical protein K6F09_09700 [Clostridiales bacterium]|nr:hypothetical protein [Clostridiales bacterium]